MEKTLKNLLKIRTKVFAWMKNAIIAWCAYCRLYVLLIIRRKKWWKNYVVDWSRIFYLRNQFFFRLGHLVKEMFHYPMRCKKFNSKSDTSKKTWHKVWRFLNFKFNNRHLQNCWFSNLPPGMKIDSKPVFILFLSFLLKDYCSVIVLIPNKNNYGIRK